MAGEQELTSTMDDSVDRLDPSKTTAVPLVLNVSLLAQGIAAIERLGDAYGSGGAPDRSAIGAHFRHVLDHYDCFFSGLDDDRVDYYSRCRNPVIENDPAAAREAARRISDRLREELSAKLDRTVRVGTGGPDDEDGEDGWTLSTVRRELAFLCSHTLHHYAIIKLLAQVEHGIDLGTDFGVAQSTLAYRASGDR